MVAEKKRQGLALKEQYEKFVLYIMHIIYIERSMN